MTTARLGERAAALSDAKRALLAARLRSSTVAESIPARPAGEDPPLSYAQERLWFMEQFVPGTAAYTIPVVTRVRGPLDVAVFSRALDEIVARHESLRMRFGATEDGRPTLVVDGPFQVEMPVLAARSEDEAHELVRQRIALPFDLASDRLIRAALIRLGEDEHVLMLAIHHIVCDGWSVDVIISELIAVYDALVVGSRSPLSPLPVQYGDFALWQRSQPHAAADVAYWKAKLSGLEPIELPTDFPRPAEQTFDGASVAISIDAAMVTALRRLARAHDATLYMVILAAFAAVLARHSGQEDFAVGTPNAGRPLRELESLVGMFVNLLTMRVSLSGDPTFVALLERVRETTLDAYAHQGLPFEQLINELNLPRDPARSALFQVVLAMQNYSSPSSTDASRPSVSPFGSRTVATRFDLELVLFEGPQGLWGSFTYNSRLFAPATVSRFASHFFGLLREVVSDPGRPLSVLAELGPAELELVTRTFNATVAEFPSEETLHGLIEARVRACPSATAVEFEGLGLTYGELNTRANRLAHKLIASGCGPGDLVAVCIPRSLELVVALLAVLKSGAGYVPLDPEYPQERLAFMASDAGVSVVLRDLDAVSPVDQLGDPPARASAGDVAYAIYTSGSTGRPKGCPNAHRGIVNRLNWMQKRYRLGADDVVLQKTPAGFDVSVWEFFWPLLAGARLVLARPGGHKDAAYLRDLIVAAGVTTIHFVPSMLGVFLAEEGVEACTSLRRIICSGEELPVDVARSALATFGGAELHNLYGPTEAAIDVTAWQCTPSALSGLARVPIGGPIDNMALYVLDAARRPLPVGVPGELYIGGVGVALGYLNRPSLTAEKFVDNPFGDGKLYRTGDLARWRPDGTIDFLGRLDTQVKLRGLRIELGEIEAALRDRPGVREAAVVVREDTPRDKRLVGYVVGDAGDDWRKELKRRLPDYMVPSALVTLEALPLGATGKLDRRALPAPSLVRVGEYVPPFSACEVMVAGIWSEVLKLERIGVDDDFFDLGGHSLLATQVIAKLRKAAGAGVSVMDLFKHRTVRELAALVETPPQRRGPRELLHELTKPVPVEQRVLSYVCVPYGGGSAVVYQPLADALPVGHRLFSVAIPGHDVGLDEQALPFDELASRCAAEVLSKVEGPIALYGHCGVGSALIVEIARKLEAAGRTLEAVYIGAIFPFARPRSRVWQALSRATRMESLRSNQSYANWLTSMGVDMSDIDPAQARQIITNMRKDSERAEEYFTELMHHRAERLRAPIVTVAGDRDPATDFYEERFREWHFLTDKSSVVVLDEAGHFFLKYRAAELAQILTGSPGGRDWRVHGVSESPSAVIATGPQPSMRRFLAVAAGQLVSILGTTLIDFALPMWVLITTGSLLNFALLAVAGLVPGLLVLPFAGAIVDRHSRRAVMLAGDVAAGGTQVMLGILFWTGALEVWHIYPLISCLSVALTFQRLAYGSAVPQLVPKQYLGHANGVVQMVGGVAAIMMPLLSVGLLASVGLGGIIAFDIVSYAFAIAVVAFVRFPATMAWRRRESLAAEVKEGLRYSWGQKHFRAMLAFFMALNVPLSPLFMMLTPLVLAFAGLDQVAAVAVAGGAGAFAGGLVMSIWGGPRHRRLHGVLMCTLVFAAFTVLIGLRPNLWLIGVGSFGISMWLVLLNGVYATIVQVKVPQRFHGRVFAINTVIAWSTLPIGWTLVGPAGSRLLEPLMAPDGALAGIFGPALGVGQGRGIGLMYVILGAAIALVVVISRRHRLIARFDDEVPDALADDLVGVRELQRRRGGTA
ncbi:MAG TPA: amino acid adenylation domain-containing protein [Candidatus Limnocylindrales bacterium]|nr:amino acid adenylation domain-containing protein [Candidatus Limnocylindrales bacterium]